MCQFESTIFNFVQTEFKIYRASWLKRQKMCLCCFESRPTTVFSELIYMNSVARRKFWNIITNFIKASSFRRLSNSLFINHRTILLYVLFTSYRAVPLYIMHWLPLYSTLCYALFSLPFHCILVTNYPYIPLCVMH